MEITTEAAMEMREHPDGLDDGELLALLRQEPARGYERLMRRYNRLLFRAARGIVPDDAEAQDVVQEAYLHAFTGLAGFRAEARLSTWLVRIVINQALQHQRKLGRLVVWDAPADEEDDDVPSSIETQRDRTAESPEQAAARNQLRRQLEAAIDLLPPIYRSVFLLRAVQGLDVEETAEALRVSTDVVKTRYLRARAQLRRQLAGAQDLPLASLHDFQGQRCDDTVRHVLARMRAEGLLRDQ